MYAYHGHRYLSWPNPVVDHEEVTTLQEVIDAWHAVGEVERLRQETWERYRETVRSALADRVPQVEIAKALDRTREMIRRDAMTDEERDEFRRARRAVRSPETAD
jgi:hypothetical protein